MCKNPDIYFENMDIKIDILLYIFIFTFNHVCYFVLAAFIIFYLVSQIFTTECQKLHKSSMKIFQMLRGL